MGPTIRSISGFGPAPLPLVLEPTFPYGEDLLQFIWAEGLFETHALRTTDRRTVEVVHPGRIQRNSGPDLHDARIRVDGQLWAGTVEVHARSSEWNAHGHQYDPAYDNVVLHVVHEHDAEVRTSRGRLLPTLELHARIDSALLTSHARLMQERGFVPCAGALGRIGAEHWTSWLDQLAVERMERRAQTLRSELASLRGDLACLFFHQLARAFGLKVNAEPFGMLANAVPLRVIHRVAADLFRTEAVLFGQAGLLQVDFVDAYPRGLQQEHHHIARSHGLRPAPLASWKFGRMRPVNFPTIRIAQMAQVLVRCRGALLDLLNTGALMELRALLEVTASDYWTDHFQFDRPATPCPKRLGRSGADHVIINAVVPVLFTMGRLHGDQRQVDKAMDLLRSLPAESNSVVAGWTSLGVKADRAVRGQALLELKDQYCTRRRCLNCAIGNHLLRASVKQVASSGPRI